MPELDPGIHAAGTAAAVIAWRLRSNASKQGMNAMVGGLPIDLVFRIALACIAVGCLLRTLVVREKSKRKNQVNNSIGNGAFDASALVIVDDTGSGHVAHGCDPGHHAGGFDAGCGGHH